MLMAPGTSLGGARPKANLVLERRDGDEGASYLDIAEYIANNGVTDRIEEDLEQLFRRVVFNVVVGNRDAIKLDESTAIPDVEAVLATSGYYRLRKSRAEEILGEIKESVATWKAEAGKIGLPRSEIELMGAAFQIG
jgi:serine/threonine-protein kinase HipA